VFSPEPYAFGSNDSIVLKRLAGIISTAVHRAGMQEPVSENGSVERGSAASGSVEHGLPQRGFVSIPTQSTDDEFPIEIAADLPFTQASRARKILLAAAAATVVFAGSWLISPRDFSGGAGAPPVSQASAKASSMQPTLTAAVAGIDSIRNLAEQGDPTAQFSIGARYATGDDVPQDYTEAIRWFSKAAEQGHVVSQATLGAYYWAGRGVPQDPVKAYFWSVLARAGGDEASKYRVSVLASRLTHAQVAAAQQQANDWIREHQVLSQNSPVKQ
jgi:TPR repeat protein